MEKIIVFFQTLKLDSIRVINDTLCDTNILIHAFNGRLDTIQELNNIGYANILLSAIGATAIVHQIPLSTYNLKDFTFMPDIILYLPT